MNKGEQYSDTTNRKYLSFVRAVLVLGSYFEDQKLNIHTVQNALKQILILATLPKDWYIGDCVYRNLTVKHCKRVILKTGHLAHCHESKLTRQKPPNKIMTLPR